MRISDWSSDVCSSDLLDLVIAVAVIAKGRDRARQIENPHPIESLVIKGDDLVARRPRPLVPMFYRIGIMEPQHLDICGPQPALFDARHDFGQRRDRKSTRLNSSH